MDEPKVTIIILNLNGKEITKDCIDSLNKIDYSNYNIIVVDNNSSDGSQNFIKKKFPSVHLIENKKNEGVAEGQNIGIRQALKNGTDYVFILNNDIIVDKNIIKQLLKGFELNDVGVTVPIMYWPDDPDRIQSAGGMIDWKKGISYHLNFNEINNNLQEIKEIDYLGLIFTSKEVLNKVGLFDKKYFAYWEDTDICLRIKKAGFKIVSIPDAKVWHLHSFTTNRIKGFVVYYMFRNMFWFMKKYSKKSDYTYFLIYFFFYRFFKESAYYLLYKKDINNFIYFCKGIIDGLS